MNPMERDMRSALWTRLPPPHFAQFSRGHRKKHVSAGYRGARCFILCPRGWTTASTILRIKRRTSTLCTVCLRIPIRCCSPSSLGATRPDLGQTNPDLGPEAPREPEPAPALEPEPEATQAEPPLEPEPQPEPVPSVAVDERAPQEQVEPAPSTDPHPSVEPALGWPQSRLQPRRCRRTRGSWPR